MNVVLTTEEAGRQAEECVAGILRSLGLEVHISHSCDDNDKNGVDLIVIGLPIPAPILIQVKRSAEEARRFRTKHRTQSHYRRILVVHTRSHNGFHLSEELILAQLDKQLASVKSTGFAW